MSEAEAEDVAWQALKDFWDAAGVGDGEAMDSALDRMKAAEPEVVERMRERMRRRRDGDGH